MSEGKGMGRRGEWDGDKEKGGDRGREKGRIWERERGGIGRGRGEGDGERERRLGERVRGMGRG